MDFSKNPKRFAVAALYIFSIIFIVFLILAFITVPTQIIPDFTNGTNGVEGDIVDVGTLVDDNDVVLDKEEEQKRVIVNLDSPEDVGVQVVSGAIESETKEFYGQRLNLPEQNVVIANKHFKDALVYVVARHIIIKDCVFENSQIYVKKQSNTRIYNNVFLGDFSSDPAILLDEADKALIADNNFSGLGVAVKMEKGNAIIERNDFSKNKVAVLFNGDLNAENNNFYLNELALSSVEDNEFSANLCNNDFVLNSDAIYLSDLESAKNLTVCSNIFSSNDSSVFVANILTSFVFKSNFLEGSIVGLELSQVGNAHIYENFFLNSEKAIVLSGEPVQLFMDNVVAGNSIGVYSQEKVSEEENIFHSNWMDQS